MIFYGIGLEQGFLGYSNFQKANEMYLRASERNNLLARTHFGRCLRDGIGIAKDKNRGMKIIEENANCGEPFAISLV